MNPSISETTPPKRIRREPATARSAIMESTRMLLKGGRSLHSLSVDTIMHEVGMRRSGFYHYYASIDEVVAEILEGLKGQVLASGAPWLAMAPQRSPTAALHEALENILNFFIEHGPLLRAIDEASRRSEVVKKAWREGTVESMVDAVEHQIRQQRAAGIVTGILNPRETSRALVLMNNAALMDFGATESNPLTDDILETLYAIWTRTLYPHKMNPPGLPGTF